MRLQVESGGDCSGKMAAPMAQIHEDLSRADGGTEDVGSERSFGFVFAAFFALLGCYPLLHGEPVRLWWLAAATTIGLLGGVKPAWLRIPNRLWFQFGNLLAAIVSPIALAALYLVGMVPTGLVMRLAGKDPLRLKTDPEAQTYWIPRHPPGPDPKGLPRQF